MRRRLKRFFFLFLFAWLSCAFSCACAQESYTVAVASDLHYLSPSLTDYSDSFMRMVESSDGKITHYTPAITRAFVNDIRAQHPDALILSGDLTFNSAPQNHVDLAALLSPLLEDGIQVLVLPGNHDTNQIAYRFEGDDALRIEGTSPQKFAEIYAPFGRAQALSCDTASYSYVYALTPRLWCLMLDVNLNGVRGSVREETFLWAQSMLKTAFENGISVFSVSHQNILTHTDLFSSGYTITNSDRLRTLYAQYGVRLNLSGHMHLQHIARAVQPGPMVDIATSALALFPTQYGVVTFEDNQPVQYRTQQVDIEGWAAKNAPEDENLLHFTSYARRFFDRTTLDKLDTLREIPGLTQEEAERMIDLAVTLNAQYFSGTRAAFDEEADWALWQKYLPDAFFTTYLKSIVDETPQDMTSFTFPRE